MLTVPTADDSLSQRPTVLLVEDEENVRQTLARYLSGAGFQVLPTSDPDAAFAALRRSAVHAIVTDVRLGKSRSGLEVLEYVRLDDATRALPVIVLTGVTLTPDEEDVIRRYPAYVLYKPHGYRDIVELLKTRLDEAASPASKE